jgi:hypothetical protein
MRKMGLVLFGERNCQRQHGDEEARQRPKATAGTVLGVNARVYVQVDASIRSEI